MRILSIFTVALVIVALVAAVTTALLVWLL